MNHPTRGTWLAAGWVALVLLAASAGTAAAQVCGDGNLDLLAEECDEGVVNGTPGSCCSATCQLVSIGTTCRPAADLCDVAETCDGVLPTCPPDLFALPAVQCRSAAGVCDVAEFCTGTSSSCPSDTFLPLSVVCRSAAGDCDQPEFCTGSSAGCPTDQFKSATTVCRSSVAICDAAETCPGNGPSCPADAAAPDSDGDGLCDPADNCPQVANPDQTDTDGDGFGDVCDPCTNVLPSFADRSKVVISHLDTPDADDTMKLKGRCVPFPESPAIDPVSRGLRIVVQDRNGNNVVDALIPGGAFESTTKAGWRTHRFPSGLTALYKNTGALLPLVQGIRKVKLVVREGLGITKFSVSGKRGDYRLALNLPLKVTVIVDTPVAATGQCCEMLFTGTPPNPTCSVVGVDATVRCR
jgi:hypothetical protein